MSTLRLTHQTKSFLAILLVFSTSIITSGAWGRAPIFAATPSHRVHVPTKSRKSSRQHKVVQYSGSRKKILVMGSRHGRYSKRSKHSRVRHQTAVAKKPRYAYPESFFMMSPPAFDTSALPDELSSKIRQAFADGTADQYPSRSLVRAGIVSYYPLHGGIFWRREAVKYIVLHSTETGVPQGARQVINSWSSRGRRHPGAQYVVDRDGSIIQAVDPDLATVHLNIFKTLPGINNDNTIGIEMCHAGKQTYPPEQRLAVKRLLSYLQGRYKVENANIITHRYAQQGDHTDPVAFDFEGFIDQKNIFRRQALAKQIPQKVKDAYAWTAQPPNAATFLQIQGPLPTTAKAPARETTELTSGTADLRGAIELDPNAASLMNAPEGAATEPEPSKTPDNDLDFFVP